MTDGNRHIADDPEFLERFVLGRLPEEERREAERHIAGCDTCAAAVRRERLIAAGARRLGRDDLKQYIREHAAVPHEKGLPWGRILSAAAAVGILVGAGLYYDWFSGTNDRLPLVTETAKQDQSPAPESASKLESTPGTTATGGQHEVSRDEDARRKTERFAAPAPAAANKIELRSEESAATRAEGNIRIDQPSSVYWTEGTPLQGAAVGGAAGLSDKEAGQVRMLGKELDTKAKDQLQKKALQNELRQAGAKYQVNQLPSAALPESQQRAQNNALKGVPTRVTQVGDTTTITLFLDSLVSPEEVREAQVQPVADDSVVVNLGNQKIGYKLKRAKTR
jgi:hypothetical protein